MYHRRRKEGIGISGLIESGMSLAIVIGLCAILAQVSNTNSSSQTLFLGTPRPIDMENLNGGGNIDLKTPDPTKTPSLLERNGWVCAEINSPEADGFNPEGDTNRNATEALMSIGKEGIDLPPYKVIYPDGREEIKDHLSDLNIVFNSELVCVLP